MQRILGSEMEHYSACTVYQHVDKCHMNDVG